tara:strand:+ start:82 stop:741 length:660 start_codon:yes stop_codon:yes gene_type:complete
MKLLSILLFLVISLGILAIAILLAPNQLSNIYFWITIVWLIILSLLNWFASTFIFIASNENLKSSTYGILPSLNIIIFIYSIFSAIFLILTWYSNDFGILSNSHLILQIIIFIIVSSLSILMFISSKASSVDESNLTSKDELLSILKLLLSKNNLEEDITNSIKELIETINYSIPHLTKLKSENNYIKLAEGVKKNFISNKISKDKKILYKLISLAKNC